MDDDDESLTESLVGFLMVGPKLNYMVRLPGLLLVQYLFVWNWKRIIDPLGRGVLLAGIAAWLVLVGAVAVFSLAV